MGKKRSSHGLSRWSARLAEMCCFAQRLAQSSGNIELLGEKIRDVCGTYRHTRAPVLALTKKNTKQSNTKTSWVQSAPRLVSSHFYSHSPSPILTNGVKSGTPQLSTTGKTVMIPSTTTRQNNFQSAVSQTNYRTAC